MITMEVVHPTLHVLIHLSKMLLALHPEIIVGSCCLRMLNGVSKIFFFLRNLMRLEVDTWPQLEFKQATKR